jgi:hypothetical protein
MAHLTEQLRHGLLARWLSPAETVAALEHVQTCTSCRDDLIALRSEKPASLDDQILPPVSGEQHLSADLLAALELRARTRGDLAGSLTKEIEHANAQPAGRLRQGSSLTQRTIGPGSCDRVVL